MKTTVPLIWAAFFTVLFLGLSTAFKIYINANGEFQKGEKYFAQNNPLEAVVHYERTLRWYIPGLNLNEKAAQKIWEIAGNFENADSAEKALNTYRILRAGFYSTRSFYTPGKTWIDRCNIKIAGLMAKKPPFLKADSGKSFDERKSEFLRILSTEKPPYPYWSLLAVTGFLGWSTCAALFIIKGIGKSGQIITRQAVYWGGGFVLSYGLWVLGMFNV